MEGCEKKLFRFIVRKANFLDRFHLLFCYSLRDFFANNGILVAIQESHCVCGNFTSVLYHFRIPRWSDVSFFLRFSFRFFLFYFFGLKVFMEIHWMAVASRLQQDLKLKKLKIRRIVSFFRIPNEFKLFFEDVSQPSAKSCK